MATGGAWQSETFDNGRDFQKTAPYVTQEAPGGTPPPMYNTRSSTPAADRGVFGALALSLRIAQIVLTLIAFSVMAANRQTIYDIYYVKFSSVKAFVGVLAVNCIVCFYAIVQLVHSIVNMASKGSFVSSATTGFALITFFFDLVLASALAAAAAAGADSSVVMADLVSGDHFSKFFQNAQASVAMSFLAFAAVAASAALYPIRLRTLATSQSA